MFIGQGITPFASRVGALGGFSIANSFLLDGVNEYFSIPANTFDSDITGSNKQFTINVLIKRASTGTTDGIFGNFLNADTGSFLRFQSGNQIRFGIYDSGVAKVAQTTTTFTDTSGWYYITFSYDYSQSLGSRGSLFVNGSSVALTTDTLTTNIDTSTALYSIGTQDINQNHGNQNHSLLYIRNQTTTLAEHIIDYNSGKPLSGLTRYGSNCIYQFNPDDSGSTAQFSVVDSVNSITATSVNLEDADKTTTTPY